MSKRIIALGRIGPDGGELLVDPRIAELEELAHNGAELPYSPAKIVQLEDAGMVVDLDTGAVELPIKLAPTAYGEAVNHLLDL